MRYDLDLPAWKLPFYVMLHPRGGFEELRGKKTVLTAVILTVALFAASVFEALLTNYSHGGASVAEFRVLPVFCRTTALFLVWIAGNKLICTLLDGAGSWKDVFVNGAFSLLPSILGKILGVVLSYIFLDSESLVFPAVKIIAFAWSVVLMFCGMRSAHKYGFLQTVFTMLFSAVATAVIVFLSAIFAELIFRVYLFICTIGVEILCRIPGMYPAVLILIFVAAIVVFAAIIRAAYAISEKTRAKRRQKKLRDE